MEARHCTSFDKDSFINMPPSDFLDKVHVKAQHQPQSDMGPAVVANVDVDLKEIYFLIMHFLSSGPCQRTVKQFCNELLEFQLLPKRYHAWYSRNGDVTRDENDDGISFPLSYESVVQRFSHIEKDHLVKLLKRLILSVAPSRGVAGRTAPSAADVPTLLGIGSFSLLGCSRTEVDVQVKPLPAYLRWPHMQVDQVRGIGLREIGGGFPKHHRAPSIRFACYAIAKPSTMVQKMQNIKKLRGHRDAVYCAIFDRTGRYVITGSDDRLVKIWSMETAFCLASCRGHEGDITDLAVNLNNSLVASASNDFNIRVWRLPDGCPISVLRGHTGAVTAIAFSPRHNSVYQLLSSSDDGTCRIWDARYSLSPPRIYLPRQTDIAAGRNSGPSLNTCPSSSNTPQNHQILCCAYNANGTVFVTGSSDTFARVWIAPKPKKDDSQQPIQIHEIDLLAGHENDVNYVQFSGCAVASRSSMSDSFVDEKVPKLKTSSYSHDNIVTCSRDGSAIIWISRSRRSQGKVARWTRAYHLKVPPPPMPPQPRRGGPRQRFLPTPRGVNMIIWSLDNRFVLAAIMDCRICVWNASDGSLVHSLTGHSESTYVLDVHPFNPRIAMSAGYDGRTIVWDIWEGIPIRVYEIGRFKLVDGKFSPDGTSIVLSDDVGQIYLLNTGQGESQKDSKYDQFFLGDYRPFGTDAHGIAIDQETQLLTYHRNIQDSLCDSSMLPYPEPYQSSYQRRRLGALNLEWHPPSTKFAIGTDIGLGQEIFPLADLDVVFEPLPEFLDAMFLEPENDVIVDSTDSEYNVTDEYSSEDEQGSLSYSSSDADSSGANKVIEGSHRDSCRRSKRKKPKDDQWTSSSRRRVKKRNLDEHENSSRSKRTKKLRNGRNTSRRQSDHVMSSRPPRVSARSSKNFVSRFTRAFSNGKVDDSDDDSSGSESLLQGSCIEDEKQVLKQKLSREDQSSLNETPSIVPPATHPELRKKLVLKFSVPKKSMASETSAGQSNMQTNATSSRLEEKTSRLINRESSGNYQTTGDQEECDRTENHFEASTGTNGLSSRPKSTIIRIKPMIKINSDGNVATSGGGDLTTAKIPPEVGECSEMDDVSQRKTTIKFKFNRHGVGDMVENTLNGRNLDNETEIDFSEAATRRTRSLQLKASSRETNDTRTNHKIRMSLGTSRNAEKSSKKPVHLMSSYGLNNNGSSASGSKSNKTNWLLLSEQEEGCRYIPQLGDEVVYLRQGHQEYLESCHPSERGGPWMLYGQHISHVEICLVDDIAYVTLPGSGESGVKLKLRFTDSSSNVHGETFELTLPELINFPDFLVERTRYDASIERYWGTGDKCNVWWRDESGGGNWWEGQICSVKDKSADFPGSPWERFLVSYEDDDTEFHRHSPWELHDKDSEWEQPRIDPDCRKRILCWLANLQHSARENEDKYGILKLKQVSDKSEFVNRFPVPLTLEIIELRLKSNYYRSIEALNHDVTEMLFNVQKFFEKNAAMTIRMARLSDWFDRKLSKVVELV